MGFGRAQEVARRTAQARGSAPAPAESTQRRLQKAFTMKAWKGPIPLSDASRCRVPKCLQVLLPACRPDAFTRPGGACSASRVARTFLRADRRIVQAGAWREYGGGRLERRRQEHATEYRHQFVR